MADKPNKYKSDAELARIERAREAGNREREANAAAELAERQRALDIETSKANSRVAAQKRIEKDQAKAAEEKAQKKAERAATKAAASPAAAAAAPEAKSGPKATAKPTATHKSNQQKADDDKQKEKDHMRMGGSGAEATLYNMYLDGENAAKSALDKVGILKPIEKATAARKRGYDAVMGKMGELRGRAIDAALDATGLTPKIEKIQKKLNQAGEAAGGLYDRVTDAAMERLKPKNPPQAAAPQAQPSPVAMQKPSDTAAYTRDAAAAAAAAAKAMPVKPAAPGAGQPQPAAQNDNKEMHGLNG